MAEKIEKQRLGSRGRPITGTGGNRGRGNPAWGNKADGNGKSGNPNGKPKKEVCVTSWLKEYAEQGIAKPVDASKLTYAQAAALSIWKKAAKGELPEYNFIIERLEGKVPQALVGAGGGPIKSETTIKVISENAKKLTEEIIEGKGTEIAVPDNKNL